MLRKDAREILMRKGALGGRTCIVYWNVYAVIKDHARNLAQTTGGRIGSGGVDD